MLSEMILDIEMQHTTSEMLVFRKDKTHTHTQSQKMQSVE